MNLKLGEVDGVSVSEPQVAFANEQAAHRGAADRVRFHLKNMLDTGFETGDFQAIRNNESTTYVDLSLLFAEYARLLRRGGRYVTITGCYNDAYGLPSRAVARSTRTTSATSTHAAPTSARWRRTGWCRYR